MPKYRVSMIEKIYYEFYIEAENEDEAEDKAIAEFENGGGEVTDQYVSDIDVEEEE